MNYKIKKIFSIILATAIIFSFANGLTVKTSYAEESIEGKIFYIKSALKNDLVLDIRGGGKVSGSNVQVYQKNGTDAQKFVIEPAGRFYLIRNVGSSHVLDVKGAKTSDATNVWQYQVNKTAAQLWDVKKNSDGTYTFVNVNSGKALDVAGAKKQNGTNVHIYRINNTAAQKWVLEPASKTTKSQAPKNTVKPVGKYEPERAVYTICSKLDKNLVIDIKGASNDDSGNVQIYTSNNTDAQKFTIEKSGSHYRIINYKSGRAIDVSGGSTANKANIQQYKWNATSAQLWDFVSLSDGSVAIINAKSGKALDVAGAKKQKGTNVWLYDKNYTDAQSFFLKKVANADAKTQITEEVRRGHIAYEIQKGKIIGVKYDKPKYVNQIATYGYWKSACGAAASLMAMQANKYVPTWTTTEKWNAYIRQFHKVPGLGFYGEDSRNYGKTLGICWGDKFIQVLNKGAETSRVPKAVVYNSLTTSMLKDNLIHGRTAIVLVQYRDTSMVTHWITVTGFYKKGNQTYFRIMDPWPNNFGSEMSEYELNRIMSSRIVTSQHKSKMALFFGEYRDVL